MKRSDAQMAAWSRFLPCVVGAPLLAALGFMAAVSLSGATGIGPFRTDPPRNPSEALVLSDLASAVWMLRNGADPAAVYDVRLTMLNSGMDSRIRPLMAAAYTGDDVTVGVALREGATLPREEAVAAACWLAARGHEQVSRMLAPAGWSPAACQAVGERNR